jgi:hypothetical protein
MHFVGLTKLGGVLPLKPSEIAFVTSEIKQGDRKPPKPPILLLLLMMTTMITCLGENECPLLIVTFSAVLLRFISDNVVTAETRTEEDISVEAKYTEQLKCGMVMIWKLKCQMVP